MILPIKKREAPVLMLKNPNGNLKYMRFIINYYFFSQVIEITNLLDKININIMFNNADVKRIYSILHNFHI